MNSTLTIKTADKTKLPIKKPDEGHQGFTTGGTGGREISFNERRGSEKAYAILSIIEFIDRGNISAQTTFNVQAKIDGMTGTWKRQFRATPNGDGRFTLYEISAGEEFQVETTTDQRRLFGIEKASPVAKKDSPKTITFDDYLFTQNRLKTEAKRITLTSSIPQHHKLKIEVPTDPSVITIKTGTRGVSFDTDISEKGLVLFSIMKFIEETPLSNDEIVFQCTSKNDREIWKAKVIAKNTDDGYQLLYNGEHEVTRNNTSRFKGPSLPVTKVLTTSQRLAIESSNITITTDIVTYPKLDVRIPTAYEISNAETDIKTGGRAVSFEKNESEKGLALFTIIKFLEKTPQSNDEIMFTCSAKTWDGKWNAIILAKNTDDGSYKLFYNGTHEITRNDTPTFKGPSPKSHKSPKSPKSKPYNHLRTEAKLVTITTDIPKVPELKVKIPADPSSLNIRTATRYVSFDENVAQKGLALFSIIKFLQKHNGNDNIIFTCTALIGHERWHATVHANYTDSGYKLLYDGEYVVTCGDKTLFGSPPAKTKPKKDSPKTITFEDHLFTQRRLNAEAKHITLTSTIAKHLKIQVPTDPSVLKIKTGTWDVAFDTNDSEKGLVLFSIIMFIEETPLSNDEIVFRCTSKNDREIWKANVIAKNTADGYQLLYNGEHEVTRNNTSRFKGPPESPLSPLAAAAAGGMRRREKPAVDMSVGEKMNPFEKLFGFNEYFNESDPSESSYEKVRENFKVEGQKLTSLANNRTFQIGKLTLPSLLELRNSLHKIKHDLSGTCTLRHEIVGDIFKYHHMHPHAVFQVASQFNLLEMATPKATPELGVTIYHTDRTQGPACALACMAATVFRNYFGLKSKKGQTRKKQLNALEHIFDSMENDKKQFLTIKNGYVDTTSYEKLNEMNKHIDKAEHTITDLLQVGVHRNVGVDFLNRDIHNIHDYAPVPEATYEDNPTCVTQVFCSALAIAYSKFKGDDLWAPLAQIILNATYEATILAAIRNFDQWHDKYKRLNIKKQKVYLTLVGGGVFGNRDEWIARAISAAANKYKDYNLDIIVCHYASMESYNTPGSSAYIEPFGPT